jgi:hypothetical protein
VITVPQSTPEKPLTAVDYCAALEQCQTVTDVKNFSELTPAKVRHDERFTRAVARRLAAIKDHTDQRRERA